VIETRLGKPVEVQKINEERTNLLSQKNREKEVPDVRGPDEGKGRAAMNEITREGVWRKTGNVKWDFHKE